MDTLAGYASGALGACVGGGGIVPYAAVGVVGAGSCGDRTDPCAAGAGVRSAYVGGGGGVAGPSAAAGT